jgi:O-antigen/teichoic acid export membrane protein
MINSRADKSLMNVKVNLLFYFISLVLSFFSRKIFLDTLGDDFIGLVGTLQNVLGFLNLAELGIGTAIGFVLYKPLFERDKIKINEIISIFGYLYRVIGTGIMILGLFLSVFLPLIFMKSGFPLQGVFIAYFAFLGSTLIGYFLNYKQTLLSADQKNYVITAYFQSANIAKTLLQIALCYYTSNFYYWIVVEVIFSVTYSFILNWRIKKAYPWLESEIKSGKKLLKKYPEVITYTKQLFVHRIASFFQGQTASIIIYAFASLKTVAYFGNYMIIINKLALLMNNITDGTGAGVGNLIAEGDKLKINQVYWELMAFRYFISGVLVFSLYFLMEPFVSIWLGPEYVLTKGVLVLVLINTYISQTRNINDMFLFGYGLFRDVWAPITEAVLSLIISLIGGYFWGLPGILAGPVISLFVIVGIWKPYFLYRDGFNAPLKPYWFSVFKFLSILFVSWKLSDVILRQLIRTDSQTGYLEWAKYAVLVVFVFSSVEFILLFIFDQGMRNFYYRMKDKLFSKLYKR